MDDTTTPAPAASPDEATVTLDAPIQRGDEQITRVTLRRPRSGELRGLRLSELLNSDVDALLALLPRITRPTLVAHELAALDPADLTQMAGEVASFLLPKGARASLPA